MTWTDLTINTSQSEAETTFFEAPWGTFRPKALQSFLIQLTRRTVLQRGAMRALMSKFITSFGAPLDITFRDCNFRIEGKNNNLIEFGLLTRPSYNGEEIDFLSQVVKDGGTALDIGCNIGLYSVPIAKAAGPNGRVVSIDANPDMVRRVQFNAKASGLHNVTALNLAVGHEDSKVDLKIRRDDVAIVSVEPSETGAVSMRPLLAIVTEEGLTQVDSLKIDIEGYEDLALVPYLQNAPVALLPRRIVIEIASPGQDYPGCAVEFARLGYELKGRSRNNSMYERV